MAKELTKTSAANVADVTPEQQAARILELEALLATKTTEHEELKSLHETVLGEKGTLETEKIVLELENKELKSLHETVLGEKSILETELDNLKSAPGPTKANDLEVEVEVIEENRPIFTDNNEKKFSFTKRTPKNLKVLGTVYSLEELVKNKKAMEFLIIGNSSFVEQLNLK